MEKAGAVADIADDTDLEEAAKFNLDQFLEDKGLKNEATEGVP